MKLVSKEGAEHYNWGSVCDGWHLAKSNNLSVIQERVPSGTSEVKHFHKKSEQFFFVLSGIATLEVAGLVYQLSVNQGFHVPSGVVHQLRNDSSSDIEFIVISTPPSHGDRVESHSSTLGIQEIEHA